MNINIYDIIYNTNNMIIPDIYIALLLDTKLNVFALFIHLILTISYEVGTFILKKRNEAQNI